MSQKIDQWMKDVAEDLWNRNIIFEVEKGIVARTIASHAPSDPPSDAEVAGMSTGFSNGMLTAARIVRERKGKYTLEQTATYLESHCTMRSLAPSEAAAQPKFARDSRSGELAEIEHNDQRRK